MTSSQEVKQDAKTEQTVTRQKIHGLILWMVAIASLVVGYYLSEIHYLDQQWLSRSGCFIVILGIWSGVGGIIELKLLHRGLNIQKAMAMHRTRRAFQADKEKMEKAQQDIQQQFQDRLSSLQSELGAHVGIIEASLLITGTFFWGFGDLVKYF
ncbi:MAG TPA: hypothetical protein VLN56_04425 [Gammaproteobacteria bacterium]|nr:hypothetical protein [Gammaproteobacteria bacterium]